MNKYSHSKSSIFLMELMMNLLFFCILLSVCMQLFIKSYQIRQNTTALTQAVTLVTNAAEIFHSTDSGSPDEFASYYDNPEFSGSTVNLYYDDSFASCTASEGTYRLSCEFTNTESNASATFNLMESESNDPVYSIHTTYHIPLQADVIQ